MTNCLVYILVLGLINFTICDVRLQIVKNTEDFITPVSNTVEEKVGATFSLICELISTANDKEVVDDNLVWIRGHSPSNQTRSNSIGSNKNSYTRLGGLNKSEKRFEPLQIEDKGNYYCVSRKFNLSKNVHILVIDNIKRNELRPMRETIFCTDQMFHCMSNGVCIIPHYVCDGIPDCKDGSDENQCNGNPCRDKIPCDDGRCIPSSWCCDRHHDQNCTVTNRPKCCQVLSESYEELEYGGPNVSHPQHSGARYLFISVCIVSILFSIVLLLLIVSKVVIFAKKTALQQQRHNLCENIALRNQTNVNIIRANFTPTNIYTVRGNSRTPRSNERNIIIDTSDVNDPLLFNAARFNVSNTGGFNDQPPSYVDVLRNNRLISEPPPPYTSREILNVNEERQERI
ncbi:low-density lipoprotein receptor class A domain-containing protein 3-like [Anoplophora glabripennis]|uniref:low-density lipoprotein receptor class A domain-containing protein 3-like n=1 Tax=Anoplophora glabripennis TaxID=217634 RepID=UPI0008747789|nr:low-density lipoprotein receptor class A domain-containing protein 3-like [Anoplophora glabripennis]